MSKLMEQVKEIQRKAHVCPVCKGAWKVEAYPFGWLTLCGKCDGTGELPAPDIDKLVSVIEVLVRPLEVHLQRLKHECECPRCKLEFTCGEGDEFDEDGRYATIDCIRLVMDGLPNKEENQ